MIQKLIITIFLKGFLNGKKVTAHICSEYSMLTIRYYNRIKREKKGYYLCKKLSKHSTDSIAK